jgi:hypothetical protein
MRFILLFIQHGLGDAAQRLVMRVVYLIFVQLVCQGFWVESPTNSYMIQELMVPLVS